jgi:acyl carrier protein
VNNDDDRLIHCFVTVFPNATRDEIKGSKFEELSGWDSLRGVTLLAVLDDEFGIQMDMTDLLELETFDALEKHLLKQGIVR